MQINFLAALRALAILIAFAFSGTAMAAYVNANGVNCRASPATTARVVAKLAKGQEVSVREGGGGWSRLVSPSCWVSSQFLSESYVARSSQRATRSGSYETFRDSTLRSSRRQSSSDLYGFSSSKTKKAHKSAKRSKSRRSSGAYGSSGGSCPCSGGSVCIGPRGGRYCITSGGNKRYGV